jgi:methyl-accepting chemotaxis protein
VPYIEGRSEINVLADSIYRFKQETLANRAAMTKRKEEDEAILNAKHQKVVDLVTQGLRALAKADLTTRFETPLDEEYDTIRQDFNSSTDLLHRVLSELSESVHELTERAEQTAAASEELSNRTLQQDRTLKETGSSLEEISEAVKGDHQTLETASSVAGEARETANASEEIMRSAIVAMDKINESSEQISQFISLIDEISFQTNLLALNAGVEAARAGEFGRGFAVVASEVRALAGRSSEAALDIKKLITQSRTQVREGVYLVGRAGNSLENIFKRIEQVDQTLQNVAQSSKCQAEDLSQVNVAMVTLLNLTEANSVMASESRLVSGTLASVAHRLAERVSEFRLNEETGPYTTSKSVPYTSVTKRFVA